MNDENTDKLEGAKAIWTFLGWRRSKFFRLVKKLKEHGCVYEERYGRPPRKRLCAMKSVLKSWTIIKAQKGETI